jgi:hypothetical protein
VIIRGNHRNAIHKAQALADRTGLAHLVHPTVAIGYWHVIPVTTLADWPADSDLLLPATAQYVDPAVFAAQVLGDAQ